MSESWKIMSKDFRCFRYNSTRLFSMKWNETKWKSNIVGFFERRKTIKYKSLTPNGEFDLLLLDYHKKRVHQMECDIWPTVIRSCVLRYWINFDDVASDEKQQLNYSTVVFFHNNNFQSSCAMMEGNHAWWRISHYVFLVFLLKVSNYCYA